MMKRLFILTAATMLTVGLSGCQCKNFFRRGSLFATPTPGVECYDPCDPVTQCDPCQGTMGPEMGQMGTGPMPGPAGS